MAEVPVAMPVTTPVLPIVATVVAALLQAPPGGPVSAIVAPAHTAVGPEITGSAFTVTIVVFKQPVLSV